MKDNLEKLAKDLEKVRSSYISLAALEEILIELPNKKKEILKKLATLRISQQKELVIQVFELKSASFIIKQILASQLGYQLVKNEKETIYFSLIPLSQETRQQLIKKVETLSEEGKVAIRNSRQKIRDSLKKTKKEKKLSENEEKLLEKTVEEITNHYLQKIEELKIKKVKSLELK